MTGKLKQHSYSHLTFTFQRYNSFLEDIFNSFDKLIFTPVCGDQLIYRLVCLIYCSIIGLSPKNSVSVRLYTGYVLPIYTDS